MTPAWYALQVKAGREVFVEHLLQAKGYEVFLPLSSPGAFFSGTAPMTKALLPGYLFCKVVEAAGAKMITTPGVIRVVGCGRSPIPIHENDLESVRRIAASDRVRYPWRYVPDRSNVTVASGILKGVRGVLLTPDSGRLIVSVHMLGRSLAVEIDPNTLIINENIHGNSGKALAATAGKPFEEN